ncbi:hypothetical protein B9Z55_023000 [Caenorhabditis nigoni]|uniref:Uncharacterized protein n=1 Tax=Caenorhabditis nigoni TaxID=1611254 RepID=A0A2G5SMX7_9PELO|nr:hypothetical protein B9Z55_023000 [Caenorhabditis nigoni]
MRTLIFEAPSDLVESVRNLEDDVLEEVCNEEIKQQVQYLETVINGWKTFGNVDKDTRSMICVLLKARKAGLFERRILYSEINEKRKDIQLEKSKNNQPKDLEMTSTPNLTAATGSGSGDAVPVSLSAILSNAIVGYDNGVPIIYEVLEAPDCTAEGESTDDESKEDEKTKNAQSSSNDNQASLDVDEILVEDDSVIGAACNVTLSKNINLARIQVREALDNVDVMKMADGADAMDDATRLNLMTLESKLIQSATEMAQAQVPVPEWKKHKNLSKGAIKRMKKQARKAEEEGDRRREQALIELNRLRQLQLAAKAVEVIESRIKIYPPPGLEGALGNKQEEPAREPEQLENLPLNDVELKILFRILKTSEVTEPGTEAHRIYEIYKDNQQILEEYILKNLNLEVIANNHYTQQMAELSNDIDYFHRTQTSLELTKEEELEKAKVYIEAKLEYWKTSKHHHAGNYIEMYKYFQQNLSFKIAHVIAGFIPFEHLPEAEFERTMLIQYQHGNYSEDFNDEQPEPLSC